MKLMKKLLSAVTAAAIGMSMTTAFSAGVSVANAADKTAVQLVEDMGLGWNLGNALDCTNTWTSPLTPNAIETAWGNPTTTESMIKEVKKSGFNTVRIPITWYQMMDSSNNIRTDYLERVKEVVDYCINNGMYAVINTHHDEEWEKNTSEINKFKTLWSQVATYFADYDEHLVFEGMNEVGFSTSDAMTYNQAFVDTVRATGGNNADRLLICTADSNNTAKALSSSFSMPTDSSDMLAVSVHYYEPSTFCVADTTSSWGHRETWGTSSDYTILENDFNKLKSKFIDSGVGVVIGEYGVCNADKYGINKTPYNKDQESIEKFLKAVASTAYDMTGICPVVWDDSNSGTITLFNRSTLSWYDSSIQQIYSDIAGGSGSGDEKEKTDRITVSASDAEAVDEDGKAYYNIDLKPYKELGLTATSVVVDYSLTSAKNSAQCSGDINMSFNITDAAGETQWAYIDNGIGPKENVTTYEIPSGSSEYVLETDDDGNVVSSVTGTFDMDYLKLQNWWTWSAATGDTVTVDIKNITVIFDGYFYTDAPISSGTTTATTTGDTSETTTTETTSGTTAQPQGDPIGNVWIAGQAGTNQFWNIDDDGQIPVSITGNGSYTASYMAVDPTASVEALMLSSDINTYEYAPEGTKDPLTDSGIKMTIDEIVVDGVAVTYSGPTDGAYRLNDDGSTIRFNILNNWTKPAIKDMSSDTTIERIIEVKFTISGLPGGTIVTTESTEKTTETTSATTTTTTTSSVATTETTSGTTLIGNPEALYGDLNLDGRVDLTDAVLLNKIVAGTVQANDQQVMNGDCNANTEVNGDDALVLLRFLVHTINSLPSAS